MADPAVSDPKDAFVSGLIFLIPHDGIGEIPCVAHIENGKAIPFYPLQIFISSKTTHYEIEPPPPPPYFTTMSNGLTPASSANPKVGLSWRGYANRFGMLMG